MRAVFQWNTGGRTLELGKRTLVMGVINVTPDSFSDGGQYLEPAQAIERGLQLLEEGADLIDVGGESTRPGARVMGEFPGEDPNSGGVTLNEELKRVVPVVTGIKSKMPQAVISVDTYRADVAREAVAAGAEIVNDISGFRWDRAMPRTVAELRCAAVLMHMRGRPEQWATLPPIGDPVLLVKRELAQWAEAAGLAGVKRDRIMLDPGFGFGKRFQENYPLIARFEQLQSLGLPLMVGTSRKSFIGRTLANNGDDAPVDRRLFGTLATHTALILKGAHILRSHDVTAAREAARVADAILVGG
jgi:dihydropteroate synthase